MSESAQPVAPAAEVAPPVEVAAPVADTPVAPAPAEVELEAAPVEDAPANNAPVELKEVAADPADENRMIGERPLIDYLAALKYADTKDGVCGTICLVWLHESGVRDTLCLCLPIPFKKLQANFDTLDVQPTQAIIQAAADKRVRDNLTDFLDNSMGIVNFISDEQAVASGELAYHRSGASDPMSSVQKGLGYLAVHPEKAGLFAAVTMKMLFFDVSGAMTLLLSDPQVAAAMGMPSLAPPGAMPPPQYPYQQPPAPVQIVPPSLSFTPPHLQPPPQPVVLAPPAPVGPPAPVEIAPPADEQTTDASSAGWWPANRRAA
jgi:hypothetical protein